MKKARLRSEATRVVVVDIDGTVAKVGSRIKFLQQEPKDWDSFYEDCDKDEPIPTVIELVQNLYEFYTIVLCTGRRESTREKTEAWLNRYEVFHHKLLMRKHFDKRHDIVVKPELLTLAGIPLSTIAFILEDRASMVEHWRGLGVTCLQVAEGNF